MFGLFKNNKEIISKEQPEYLELITKWDAFLAKIEVRFNESLVHAEAAILDNLVESDYDYHPTQVAWMGIKKQLGSLSDKIETTFEDKVKPEMVHYVKEYETIEQEQKGRDLSELMYSKMTRFEVVLDGKVSQKFYDHAITFLNEDFKCTQCSGKIEVRKDIFRSHYISCGYCNTVNTFTPNDKIGQIKNVVQNISKYNALTEWDHLQTAENDFREIRNPAANEDKTVYTQGFKNREQAERIYWTKFLQERLKILPEFEETLEHDLAIKMSHFYKERKRELNF